MKPRMKGKPGTTLPRNQSSWLIYTEEAGRIQHKMVAEQSRKWPETKPLRWNAILHLMAATINSYHDRFTQYLKFVQSENLVIDGAMTDPKGDRALSPSLQADPDLYLHVVSKTNDGIIVRGAKAHQTGICNSHEILVMPTVAMKAGEEDYAVSFAVPSDTKGITIVIGRQSCDTRKLEGGCMDAGNCRYGGVEHSGTRHWSRDNWISFDFRYYTNLPWSPVFRRG